MSGKGLHVPFYGQGRPIETPASKLWREIYVITFTKTADHDIAESEANKAVRNYRDAINVD